MIERKIIILFITSTEFNQKLQDLWEPALFESGTAKRMATWCLEYYKKYEKAPGKDIEPIFYEKVKKGLPKDLAEEIEQDILPGLSDESDEEPVDTDYMIDQAIQYFNSRRLLLHADQIKALVETNQIEDAEKRILEFKPLEGPKNKKLDTFILGVEEIRKKKIPRAELLLSPWLRKGETTIIYGNFGSGKSLLTISIAYLLGLKNFDEDEHEIGTWHVKRPTGCLYLDGELGEHEMEERIAQFEWLGRQHVKHKIKILSVPEFQLATEDTFVLSSRENQMKIIKWLREHEEYKLIVLDSASTLFGLVEENDNSEWNNKINPFLRDLRALGVACLMLHHAGKDGKKGLRGASSMGAMAHNIFKLSDHPDKDRDRGEAWFVLTKDKQRSAGFGFKTFALHYQQNDDKTETHWSVTKF